MSSVYRPVLAERFDLLHPTLRHFFGAAAGGNATGRLRVTRSPGRLRNLAARLLGIPPAGEYTLRLEVFPRGGLQRWVRRLGGHTLITDQAGYRDLLVEWAGSACLGFELVVEDGSLLFRRRRAWVLGVPWPLWLAPDVAAENRPQASGGWWVRVCFRVPLLGQVAEYEGEVAPEGPHTSSRS